MSVNVIMPQMGESIFEGTITKWLKKPGEKIERDEPLFEISTDKVDAEIPSPSSGILQEIKVGEGQTVPIQTVVAVIASEGAAVAAPAPAASAPAPAAAKPAASQGKVAAPPSEKKLPPVPAPAAARRSRHAAARNRKVTAPRKSAAPLWCGRWQENTTSTSRNSPAPAPAAESASRTSWVRSNPVPHSASAPRRLRTAAGGRPAGRHASAQRRPTAGPASAGNRRASREDVLRELPGAADDRDAPANCRAHGDVEARFAARIFGGRSRTSPKSPRSAPK